ncbi:helix-turn-helix domain-containing protein [Cobetia marina]|uniref:helix-turn-helix domain-containing protein n=1 Tax=Cobetia marina TaxID=28258 RepID=UPI00349F39F7
MPTVTVNEAAKLVGRSRRGIYRDMASGRLSYKTDRDGHRRIDTSELERVHGALSLPVTPPSDSGTPQDGELVAEIRALREELAGLREEVRELRRLPAPETPAEPPQATLAPAPSHGTQHNFSDLIDAIRRGESSEG